MKNLHLLATGHTGGIETLCNNIGDESNLDNRWCFLFSGGKIAEEMKEKNTDNVLILAYKKYKLYKFIQILNKYIKQNMIDNVIVHHSGMYCDVIFSILKRKNKSVKFVRILHSCYEDDYSVSNNAIKRKFELYYMNKALQVSELIISVSKAVQRSYEKRFDIENKKRVVIYNGIPKRFNNIQKDKAVNKKEKITIIYIGRLVKVKGVDLLIDAFSKICVNHKNLELIIVGDGNERFALEQRAKEKKVKVDFVGIQRDVIKWLDKSDIFVYPSIWEEAFGISVVEAMSRGVIPITFNKGGLPEIILNEKNGFLVKNMDYNSLGQYIEKCIKLIETDLAKDIRRNAMDTAKGFIIDNTIKKLEENLLDL